LATSLVTSSAGKLAVGAVVVVKSSEVVT
jgi:hypothetical protein